VEEKREKVKGFGDRGKGSGRTSVRGFDLSSVLVDSIFENEL